MDTLLYGISKSLEYLGEQRQVILHRMETYMLEYLMKNGTIRPSDGPEEVTASLRNLLTRSGYGQELPLRFEGSPPRPSLPGLIRYLSEGQSQTATMRSKRPARVSREKRVDWVIYEMALYGMTKGLDELGEQAQLLLDSMGTEMLNHLVEKGKVEPSEDPDVFIKRASGYFMKAGFADEKTGFRIEGSPPDTLIGTYVYSRYHLNVLKRLREANCLLYSCPPCLVGHSIMRGARGLKIQFAVEMRVLPGGKVVIRHKIHPPVETFTEEQAQKISRLMG